MRKWLVSVLMTALLLLPGCGEREKRLETGFEAFREAVTLAESITARAELTVSSGATAADYVMRLSYDGQRLDMTLEEPELLAGVTASVLKGETELMYGGVRLGAGPIDADGLTPVSALPAILEAMESGYVELLWWEGDYMAARLHIGDTSVLTLWLEGESLTPVTAEIASGGLTVMTCSFNEWVLIKPSP